jgi:alanine dehydrogenase
MDSKKHEFTRMSATGLMPQEEMLEVKKDRTCLTIGIPKDENPEEDRIPLVPETVNLLIQNNHRVLIEKDAGLAAHYSNEKYQLAGAELVFSKEEVYEADIILKAGPPTEEEVQLLKPKKTVFSSLHWTGKGEQYFRSLLNKRVTALAFETIMDRFDTYPIVRSMSEIAGTTSIILGAEYLSSQEYGRGSILGGFSGISPSEIVILGAGTVGEYAARTAMGMGAIVKVFDNDIYRLRRMQNSIGQRIYTSLIQPQTISDALKNADLVIGAMRPSNGRSPIVVTEEMVQNMKYGAVIIDVSIDHGGCIETSKLTCHKHPVFKKYDVTHYCVPNMASRVAHTASRALSNILGPVLLSIGENGGIDNTLKLDLGVRNGVYVYKGTLTNKNIGDYFHIKSQDINLLLTTLF